MRRLLAELCRPIVSALFPSFTDLKYINTDIAKCQPPMSYSNRFYLYRILILSEEYGSSTGRFARNSALYDSVNTTIILLSFAQLVVFCVVGREKRAEDGVARLTQERERRELPG